MSIRYPKPLRLPIGSKRIDSKKYMRREEMHYLLSGKVAVEEKMDGRSVSCANTSFTFFAEDLRVKHSIAYKVPARFAVFDVLDNKRGIFLAPEDRDGLVNELGLKRHLLPELFASGGIFPVRVLEQGVFSPEDLLLFIQHLSAYAVDQGFASPSHMEGIVVKQSRELFQVECLFGKLVREEFIAGIAQNYMGRNPPIYNRINPSFGIKE